MYDVYLRYNITDKKKQCHLLGCFDSLADAELFKKIKTDELLKSNEDTTIDEQEKIKDCITIYERNFERNFERKR